ncbi:glycosyltransferase family 2 protein [Williamsia sp. MIQD14]|uniref:glycosyltransferase family 2 protein n=1 Tax=Williamsia sp. MIQD14 TaxID=3425703 RepID=UPI003DA17B54
MQVTMACAFVLAGISLARFSIHTVWLYPLLAVLAVNVTGSVLSALSGWNSRIPSAATHRETVRAWHADRTVWPSVDIFLPTCGEDMSVLFNTYTYVKNVQWRGELRVLVLDDGGRDEVRAAAEEFGFDYLVRPNRGHMKKAGNLQYAFGQSHGDFIAIFDADFCPRADYLEHLVPYTEDREVGIVQSPQYFSTEESMNWLERTAGATQELFYRWVQPSRDRAGAPICVGTCALYRREALSDVGGFAQIEHSEDVHTGIFLLRGGYRTRYVPILVSKGLCPSDLAGFLNQQYRWCNGSITLLQSRVAQRQPLSLRQRLCFWAGFMYYISTALNVFVLHVPAMVMAIFFADQIRASHFIPFMAGAWVYFVLMPRVSVGQWRFEVMRTQMAYGFCHALAITHKLTGRTRGWVATGAVGKSSSLARTISKVGAATLIVTLGVSWAAWGFDTYQYGLREFWTMGLFLLGYTYLSVPLIGGFARVLGIIAPSSSRPPQFTQFETGKNRISMFEAIGYSALILFAAVIASGYFDLVIPWS